MRFTNRTSDKEESVIKQITQMYKNIAAVLFLLTVHVDFFMVLIGE
jgi:hypothetical protein